MEPQELPGFPLDRYPDQVEEFFLRSLKDIGLDRLCDRFMCLDAGRPEDLQEIALGVVEVEAQ